MMMIFRITRYVEATHLWDDEVVRVIIVHWAKGLYKRSVQQLCSLPIEYDR